MDNRDILEKQLDAHDQRISQLRADLGTISLGELIEMWDSLNPMEQDALDLYELIDEQSWHGAGKAIDTWIYLNIK